MTMNMNMDKRRSAYDRDSTRDSSDRSGGGPDRGGKYDDPPNSRLFIVCGKDITEEQFRESFGVYGTIEEVWILKDRVTQDPKGVTYIKYSKTSEAALAMEEMNGKCVTGSPRPLKVLIAHSRDQGSRRDMNEEERLLRLFVVVPKSMNEHDLRQSFSQFGDIDYVSIVRDRNTKESKGFAYVKYHRMSHSARAFEGCDRSFKPVFADPKPQKSPYHEGGGGGGGGGNGYGGPGSTTSGSTAASVSAYDMLSYMDTTQSNPDGVCRLTVIASPSINQDQLWRLFDIIPGLDYCDLKNNRGPTGPDGRSRRGQAVVVYNNPQSATYAKEKLHGFEYPPGYRMIVKFDFEGGHRPQYDGGRPQNAPFTGFGPPPTRAPPSMPPPPTAPNGGAPPPPRQPSQNLQNDLAHLTETIANATALLQAAGYSTPNAPVATPTPPPSGGGMGAPSGTGETYDPSYCSVKLPPPQPLATMDSSVAERLFIVCTPTPPHLYALKDVFGRFGNLIDIYMLNGKTCGYAKYAVKDSADLAVTTLHGQEVCGSRLKVMHADPQEKGGNDPGHRKRQKISDGDH